MMAAALMKSAGVVKEPCLESKFDKIVSAPGGVDETKDGTEPRVESLFLGDETGVEELLMEVSESPSSSFSRSLSSRLRSEGFPVTSRASKIFSVGRSTLKSNSSTCCTSDKFDSLIMESSASLLNLSDDSSKVQGEVGS